MKILMTGSVYESGVNNFRDEFYNNKLEDCSYAEVRRIFDEQQYNYFVSGWCEALREKGHQVHSVIMNVPFIQQKWCDEYLARGENLSPEEVLIEQIKHYKPDVFWYDGACNESLYKEIKMMCPFVKLVVGWAGSAPAKQDIWKYTDLVFCCAPEGTEYLNEHGANAIHMDHAYLPSVNSRLSKQDNLSTEMLFIGSIVREKEFHLYREQLLVEMSKYLDIKICSPNACYTNKDIWKALAKMLLYKVGKNIPEIVWNGGRVTRWPNVKRWTSAPKMPVHSVLKKKMRPPVYGLEMFNSLYNAEVVLNIHADSSPIYASNMRLFETTGVGSCLLTDMKKNLGEMFALDSELVAYDSFEDCLEKAKWLIAHPKERQQIAKAGQQRCLRDHTYANRVELFERTVRKNLL